MYKIGGAFEIHKRFYYLKLKIQRKLTHAHQFRTRAKKYVQSKTKSFSLQYIYNKMMVLYRVEVKSTLLYAGVLHQNSTQLIHIIVTAIYQI